MYIYQGGSCSWNLDGFSANSKYTSFGMRLFQLAINILTNFQATAL